MTRVVTENFFRSFLGRVVKRCLVLVLVVCAVSIWQDRQDLLSGLGAGFVWLSVNSFLIQNFLDALLQKGNVDSKQLMILVFVKFGVLYAVGLWLFLSPHVALMGIFLSFTVYFVAMFWAGIQSQLVKK